MLNLGLTFISAYLVQRQELLADKCAKPPMHFTTNTKSKEEQKEDDGLCPK